MYQIPAIARRSRHGRLTVASIALLIAASSGLTITRTASAQTVVEDRIPKTNGNGVDLHLFRPAVDSKGFFTVNGADILGKNDLSIGLVLDYGHGMMPLAAGHGADWMVKHSFQGTIQFNFGLFNYVAIGLTAPIALNIGDRATDIGPGGAGNYTHDSYKAQAFGNLALHVKVPILRPDAPIGIAILAQVGYGLTGTRDFAAEPGFFYWPQLILEKHASIVRIGLNAGFRGHLGKNTVFGDDQSGAAQLKYGTFENGQLVTGGVAISVRPAQVIELAVETYGTYLVGGESDKRQRFSAEAIGGLKLFVEKNSFFVLGAGSGYTQGFQTAVPRATIGFIFEPSIGSKPPPEEPLKVAPEPPPKPAAGDRDGDGILDANDKCPDDPEDRDGFEDEDGCPDPDNDKDGIPDKLDKCPNEPEDKDGFEDDDGCPDPDNDKDGLPDIVDKCPNEPETFNGFQDEDGCPDQGRVIVQENNVIILDKINFKTGSAEILKDSFPIIDAVVATLKHNPGLKLIEVQGHADERGIPLQNLKLTEARAASVVEALVKRGVEKGRVRSMGFGIYCPLDPAHNAKAWEKNRRVEFKVVISDKGPTGVELGCDAAKAKGIVSPPLPEQQ